MLLRLVALLAYPAHLLNRALAGPLGRIGLRRVPGALVVGLALLALSASTASATLAAFEARPEPLLVTVADVVDGHLVSGLWIEFDAELVEGPHRASVEVSAGGGAATLVERVHYLVADPAASDRALVVRFAQPIPRLDAADGPVRLDGTITEDSFHMRTLLEGWGIAERYPELTFSHSRLIAYAFSTPWREPSWLGTAILGVVAALILAGAFIPYPLLRRSSAVPAAGETPIRLAIHGELPTPRGPVRLHGTPAQLEWMNVQEVARTRWRYWGAGLGDVRGEVEDAVRSLGAETDRLVIHGPTGSVIWPIEAGERLRLEAGDAYLGLARHPALRVRGDGATATLTFADAASRDAALAELGRGRADR
jgi:hypothetical protein